MPASQSTAPTAITFYDAFRQNMHTLGLPAPRTLFETATTAQASVNAISKVVDRYPNATLREVFRTMPQPFGAAAMAEYAVITGGLFAAYYVAACITSAVLAVDQTASMRNLTLMAAHMGVRSTRGWLMPSLALAAARSGRR